MALVYIHRKKSDNTVFYVGYSSNLTRPYNLTGRSTYWHHIYKKHGRDVEIVISGLKKEEALRQEINLIEYYGRTKDGGTLCNLTDGGEGSSGYIRTKKQIEDSKSSKITYEIADSIREDYLEGGEYSNAASLSDKYNMSMKSMLSILRNESWVSDAPRYISIVKEIEEKYGKDNISFDKSLQQSLNETVESGKYTETLGEYILKYADEAVYRNGLYYKFSQFDVDFIIRPRIVDDLLIKCKRYDKDKASALTFFKTVIATGIMNGIAKARAEKKAEFSDVFYYEDMLHELMQDEDVAISEIDVIQALLTLNNK